MSDSPTEYVEKLKRENAAFRAALEKIAALEAVDNFDVFDNYFTAKKTARAALGK